MALDMVLLAPTLLPELKTLLLLLTADFLPVAVTDVEVCLLPAPTSNVTNRCLIAEVATDSSS
jgi:hypothetical protein